MKESKIVREGRKERIGRGVGVRRREGERVWKGKEGVLNSAGAKRGGARGGGG